MRAIASTVLAVLALGACNRPTNAPAGATNAPAAPVAANAPATNEAAADPFVGSYKLAGGEGPDKGTLVIAQTADGYTAAIDVGAPGCGGQAKGAAIRAGDTLHLMARIEDTALKCEVEIKRLGETLVVEEGAGCGNFHGASCDLNGTATRK